MSSTLLPIPVKRPKQKHISRRTLKKLFIPLVVILAVLLFLCIAIGPSYNSRAQSNVVTTAHTSATVNDNCKASYYSRDGNPFQLCPGPYPGGGNCVWWGMGTMASARLRASSELGQRRRLGCRCRAYRITYWYDTACGCDCSLSTRRWCMGLWFRGPCGLCDISK